MTYVLNVHTARTDGCMSTLENQAKASHEYGTQNSLWAYTSRHTRAQQFNVIDAPLCHAVASAKRQHPTEVEHRDTTLHSA
jgi:hypothetical protein